MEDQITIIGETKYGPVQTFRRHERPRLYICACCVMHVGVPQDDGRYCSTCRVALQAEARGDVLPRWNRDGDGNPINWLEHCKRSRDELREIDRLFPTHLDYHAWRYLHEEGQDQDEIEASAIEHEEARREVDL